VVLLDIGMPGLDGYEVGRRLREKPSTRKALLIAITGWGGPEDLRKSKESGFDHHLVKPVEPAALQRLLARRSLARPSRSSPEP
jgi:two-component system CheB/CheR fusion protein